MKQLIAEQILSNILTDTKTHFKSTLGRFLQGVLKRDDSKSTGCKLAGQVFVGNWENVPVDVKGKILDILPVNLDKSVAYDLKKDQGSTSSHIENVPGNK